MLALAVGLSSVSDMCSGRPFDIRSWRGELFPLLLLLLWCVAVPGRGKVTVRMDVARRLSA